MRARFAEDAHVCAAALFDEVMALGYAQSYQTFTLQRSFSPVAKHYGVSIVRCRPR